MMPKVNNNAAIYCMHNAIKGRYMVNLRINCYGLGFGRSFGGGTIPPPSVVFGLGAGFEFCLAMIYKFS